MSFGTNFGIFVLLGAFFHGIFTSEAALWAGKRQRSRLMEIVAGSSAGAGLLFTLILIHAFPWELTNIMFWAIMFIGVVTAVNRVRYI